MYIYYKNINFTFNLSQFNKTKLNISNLWYKCSNKYNTHIHYNEQLTRLLGHNGVYFMYLLKPESNFTNCALTFI
jgi:hypothetical protein